MYRLMYHYGKNSNTCNIKYFFKRIAEMESSYIEYFKLNVVNVVGVRKGGIQVEHDYPPPWYHGVDM